MGKIIESMKLNRLPLEIKIVFAATFAAMIYGISIGMKFLYKNPEVYTDDDMRRDTLAPTTDRFRERSENYDILLAPLYSKKRPAENQGSKK